MTYKIEDVFEYVKGWLMSDSDLENLTMNQIKAMLNNALITVDDPDDGLEWYVNR